MKLLPLFMVLTVFVFTAFLFPTLYSACANVNTTSISVHEAISVFPIVFLGIVVLVPIYLIIKEKN